MDLTPRQIVFELDKYIIKCILGVITFEVTAIYMHSTRIFPFVKTQISLAIFNAL